MKFKWEYLTPTLKIPINLHIKVPKLKKEKWKDSVQKDGLKQFNSNGNVFLQKIQSTE